MSGAINFAMTDIYGGVWGTTEETIPEAADQNALPDDQKAAEAVTSGRKSVPILLAVGLFIAMAVVFGGAK